MTTPYWQAATAAPALPQPPLPPQVDVLIVGAGYTGLAAARETAALGASTLVLDAGALGAGCSGRNGGQVAYSIKPSLASLTASYGGTRALAIAHEGRAALDHLRMLAVDEGLDCDWRAHGCYYGAHTRREFDRLAREAGAQPRGLEQRISVIPAAEQRREIASDFYHGGLVYHDDAAVDPMRMLLAMLRRARDHGASVVDHCPVLGIARERDGFAVSTAGGTIKARKVLLATNGYSGPLSAWHRRRVIPIGSYQIATEPLGRDRVLELIPQRRNVVDTRRVVVYFRPSPDGERIVFGGRAALSEKDPLACVPRLKSMLTQVFPQLAAAKVAHAWVGWVAYTFDTLPHLGEHDGMHYCMGYCGQGVPLAPYFGRKIGLQMMGSEEGRTALDARPFHSRPYYFGKPWFLAPSVLAYRTLDAWGTRRADSQAQRAGLPASMTQPAPIQSAAAPTQAATPSPAAAPAGLDAARVRPVSARVATRLWQLAFAARGEARTSTPAYARVRENVTAMLQVDTLDRRFFPLRPALMPQLLQAVNDPDAAPEKLARIVAHDPVLTADVLRLANSSLYRVSATPIETIQRAIVVCGVDGLRGMLASAMLRPVFRATGRNFPRLPRMLWDRTERAARAAELYAMHANPQDRFEAQLSVLSGALGPLVVYSVALDVYARNPHFQPDGALCVELIGALAPRLSQRIARDWHSSPRLVAALDESAVDPLAMARHVGELFGTLSFFEAQTIMSGEERLAALDDAGIPAGLSTSLWTDLHGNG